jgi:DNA-dependent RNA polymerase auxiliary subunit epsilon
MSSGFKITTWEGHDTMQIKTATKSLYLDGEDVQRLREYFKNKAGEP